MRVVALFVLLIALFSCSLLQPTSAAVVVQPLSVSFPFLPANFAPAINTTEICGALRVADPLDGCAPLLNGLESNETGRANFIVIARGGCYFVDKIRHAQDAGFGAAIVYDDQPDRDLITMGGSSEGINIHAVFVSKVAGEFLKLYAPLQESNCCIIPPVPHTSDSDTSNTKLWGYIAMYTFGLVFLISGMVALMIWRCWSSLSRENSDFGTVELSSRLDTMTVETIPCFTFRAKGTCAICLEDYKEEEIIDVFPCKHEFHSSCAASWLTRGTFCPVCRLDVRTKFTNSTASRTAPV